MGIRLWILSFAAVLIFYPFPVQADHEGIASAQSGSSPPVAQTLVREGDFAVKLAAELDLGLPSNEAVAEDLLAKAGVAPLNGWISDYPVTPQIIGQLKESVSRAASRGKIPMTSDQATKGLYALAAQLNLPTPAQEGSAKAAAPEAPASVSSSEDVNDYYDEIGPPIITYYAPPYDYAYLYDWVPYPVWWFGFWFPGFYICNDFSTIIVYQGSPVVVSDRFIDHRTGTVVRVDPLGSYGHYSRPVTDLRTDSGHRFRNVADLHRGVRWTGLSGEWRTNGRGRGPGAVRPGRTWSPAERRSAGAIYSRSWRSRPESRGYRDEGSAYSGRGIGRSDRGEARQWSRQGQRPGYSLPQNGSFGDRSRYTSGQGRTSGSEWLSRPNTIRGRYSGPVYGTGRQRSRSFEGRQNREEQRGGGFSGRACRGRC